MPQGANDEEVAITSHSMAISHNPRLSRNAPSDAGVLRAAIRPALTPARHTNAGAQKWVIQRVRKSARPTLGSTVGSCAAPAWKKSRTWSRAMITMTRPRTMSSDTRR